MLNTSNCVFFVDLGSSSDPCDVTDTIDPLDNTFHALIPVWFNPFGKIDECDRHIPEIYLRWIGIERKYFEVQ